MSDEQSKININDLADDMPEQNITPGANAYDSPPPVPDGVYTARVHAVSNDSWKSGETKKGQKYLAANVEYEIVDDSPDSPVNGRRVFDSPSTMVFDNSKTNPVVTLVEACGGSVPPACSPLAQAKALVDVTASEPLVRITTQWEAYSSTDTVDDAGKAKKVEFRKKGMKGFPLNDDGSHTPVIETPWGESARAFAKIKRVEHI